MSLTNPNTPVSQQDLQEFYHKILPYIGRSVDAGFTPVGSIIAIMGVTAPANYLACDGTVYNIADYSELANYFYQQFGSKNFFGGDGTTTFAVPDLRGEFLRGTGSSGYEGQGSGSDVGVHQNATEIPYLAANTTNSKTIYTSTNEDGVGLAYADKLVVGTSTTGLQLVNNALSTTWSGSNGGKRFATRPTNTSVLFCIAVKDIYASERKYNKIDLLGTSTTLEQAISYGTDVTQYSFLLVKVNVVNNGTETNRGTQIMIPVIELELIPTSGYNSFVVTAGGSESNFTSLYAMFSETTLGYWFAKFQNNAGFTNVSYVCRLYGIR